MSNRNDKHWTERSAGSYQFMVAFDFVNQLDEQLEERGLRRSDLAAKLGVTQGRVSQIFNNPRGLNLQTIIRLARAAGLKVSVVTYDDHDPENARGPIESRVFRLCWERAGRPREAWDLLEERGSRTLPNSEPTWLGEVEEAVCRLFVLPPASYDPQTVITFRRTIRPLVEKPKSTVKGSEEGYALAG